MFARRFLSAGIALSFGLMASCLSASAVTISWDREKNAEQAGRELAEMWAKKGAFGIFKYIEDCHEEHIIQAKTYSREAETCLVQDVVHSRVSAQMYRGLSDAARQMSGSPKPEAVIQAMNRRLVKTLRKFEFSREEAREIAEVGFEACGRIYFETLKERMAAAQKRGDAE